MSGGLITIDTNEITAIAAIETKVAALSERYSMLEIAGPDDRKGFDRVHEARMDVRDLRITTEKRRKAAKEAVTQFGKALDGAANKIFALIEPLESSLQAKEDAYNAAKERIKAEAEAARKAKLQARVDALQAVRGAVPLAVLEALTDEQFGVELNKATWAYQERQEAEEKARIERERQEAEARKLREAEEARIAAERAKLDAERKAQEEADAKRRAELEAESARLMAERQAQIDAERAKLEAERKAQEEQQRIEREKIEAERRKADEAAAAERAKQAEAQRKIDEERRKLEAEKARLEREEFERQAKAKAEQEAREKLARDKAEQERLDTERKEREAAEAKRREEMKPDIVKLRDYAAALEAVPIPSVSDPNVYQIVLNAHGEVERMCERIEKWCDEQEGGA